MPIQDRHNELMNNPAELKAILETGREKAAKIADEKLEQVKQSIGLI